MLELLDRLAVRSSVNKLYRGKTLPTSMAPPWWSEYAGVVLDRGQRDADEVMDDKVAEAWRSGAGAATSWCCGGGVAMQCVGAGGGFRRFSASLSHRSKV
jgi:hypothetical protein